MHLNRVVFPHPDGPINAVTQFSLTSRSIPFNASLPLNQAFKDWIDSLGFSILNSKSDLRSVLDLIEGEPPSSVVVLVLVSALVLLYFEISSISFLIGDFKVL